MTNREAILRISDHCIIHFKLEPEAIKITEALSMAIKALEQQDKERWIPVSERLPDVLCDIEDEDCPYFNVTLEDGLVCTLQFTGDGEDWFDEFGTVYNNVVAWKPMPEEYKGE